MHWPECASVAARGNRSRRGLCIVVRLLDACVRCYCRSISASFPCFLLLHSCTLRWSSSGVVYRVSICLNLQDLGSGFGPWPASFSVHRMRDQIATVDGRRCQFSYIILSHVMGLGIILSMHRTGRFPKPANHNQHAISEQSWVDNMERRRSCLRASCRRRALIKFWSLPKILPLRRSSCCLSVFSFWSRSRWVNLWDRVAKK